MDIYIKSSSIQFKNPTVGQPTRAIADHYNGRRITIDVDEVVKTLRFTKEEMPFIITEDEMIVVIETQLANK